MHKKKKRIVLIAVVSGLAVNLALFFLKFYIGLSTNSIGIYADSINNLIDSIACAAATVGMYIAAKSSSEKYPYGFGRAEEITDLLISVFICVTAFYFAYISLERLMYPIPVWYSPKYALLIALTIAVKAGLAVMFSATGKKAGSSTLLAMRTDSILDFFITAATLISFTLSEKIGYSLDGVSGMLIAVIIEIGGIRMLVSAISSLIGKRDESLCLQAEKILREYGLENIGRINCHRYGENRVFTVSLTEPAGDAVHWDSLEKTISEELNGEIYFDGRSINDE